MKKLPMPKRFIENRDMRAKSALLKPNKKLSKEVSKGIKRTLKKEEEMKTNLNIFFTILSLVAIVFASYQFTFKTGVQYQKINSGIETLAENQKKIISMTEKSDKRVAKLEKWSIKNEIFIQQNKVFREKLTQYKIKK